MAFPFNGFFNRNYFLMTTFRTLIITPKITKFRFIILFLLFIVGCDNKSENDADIDSTGGNQTAIAISGAVSIPSSTIMDSDVNDINSPYQSNDSEQFAQNISNPISIGGYVNTAGSGPAGRSQLNGDVDDYFRTVLIQGQTISLFIGATNTAANNLDLFLIDEQGSVLSSQGTDGSEQITVQTSGSYFIRVHAQSGASNYLLSVRLPVNEATSLSDSDLNINDDFVPGEVIVRFKNSIGLKQNLVASDANGNNRGLVQKAGAQNRNILFKIEDTASAVTLKGVSSATPASIKNKKESKRQTLDVIRSLRKRADVVSARPNYIRKAKLVPNDEYYHFQWHYPQINLPQAWNITTGNSEVVVAVIDTGILNDHPDLQGQLQQGYDFIRDQNNAADGDGIDDNPYDVGDGGANGASSYHGTHVAGTIAAASNNNTGVAGVAWNVKVMPLRVLGQFGGTDYDIEQAVRYAAGLENDSGTVPAQTADVINLSLGGPIDSTIPPEAFVLARQAGVIIVAAAGNEASSQNSYPASLDGVVSVSAIDINKNVTNYSNYGAHIDVTAPGGNILSDINADGYADGVLSTLAIEDNSSLEYMYMFYQGTSMSAPHVAGVIALMKSVYPELSPQDFDNLLAAGSLTEDLGNSGRDDFFGHGLIDAYKAVQVASQLAGTTPAELDPLAYVTPQVLNFSFDRTALTFTLGNSGGGELSINSVSDDANGWLSVEPLFVDSNGLGTYQATLHRNNLPNEQSISTAEIEIETTQNRISLTVIAISEDNSYENNAGVHYIRLLDNSDGSVVSELQLEANGGEYNYEFTGVGPGEYIILAGSNPDNNDSVCEAAESCGRYPTVGSIQKITVTEHTANLSGINFETNFTQISIGNLTSKLTVLP